MRFLRVWVVTSSLFALLVACGDNDERGGCSDPAECELGTVCHRATCVDPATLRLQVTAVSEGADAAVFVYDQMSGASCQAGSCPPFPYGASILLRASPIGGHRFIGWQGDAACVGSDLELAIPALTDDLDCVALYTRRARVTGIVAGAPEGTSSGVLALSDHPTASCQDATCEVDVGTPVTLRAPLRWGERFGSWSGPGCGEATTPETMVVPQEGDLVCTARYIGRVTVAARAEGVDAAVEVSSSTPGAVCQGGSCLLDRGGAARLSAPDVAGFRFAGWSGTMSCSGGNPELVIDPVSAPEQCLATYLRRVRVSGSATGPMPPPRIVAFSGDAFATCIDQSCEVDVGGSATLLASSARGYRLIGWSGPMCGGESGAALELTDVMEDTACVAEYGVGIAVIGAVVGAPGEVVAASTSPGASCAQGGCVLVAGGSAALTAPSIAGHRFLGWDGDEGCASQELTIRFEGVTESRTCYARYAPRFSVSGFAAPAEGGTVIATSPTPGAICAASSCSMEGGEVLLEARPHAGFRFAGWSGGGACVGAAATLRIAPVGSNLACQANFVPTISVTGVARPEGAGFVSVNADLGAVSCMGSMCTVDRGATVGVSATPAEGFEFTGWSECSSERASPIELPSVTASTVCVANFTPRRFTVASNVAPAGAGTVVASSGSPAATCEGGRCTVNFNGAVRLVATPAPGFQFSGWSGCSAESAPDITRAAVRTNETCTANFIRVALTLTANAGEGGDVTVVSAADGASCAGASCSFPYGGGTITLRATPRSGYTFAAWSGEGCPSTGPEIVLSNLTTSVTCAASFTRSRFTVSASAMPGDGGAVVAMPVMGATCSGAICEVDLGGSVQLAAVPSAGFRFVRWGGCSDSTDASLALANVTASATCTASFERVQHRVRGTASPPIGGTVTVGGGTCPPEGCLVNEGASTTMLATTNPNFTFSGWSGASCPGNGTATNPLPISEVLSSIDCQANFAGVLQRVTLTPGTGGGGGVRISTPAGCQAATGCDVPYGSPLVAVAEPNLGYRFSSWTGLGCSGSGPQLTIDSVLMPLTCTASFVQVFTLRGAVTQGQETLGTVTVGTVAAGACPDNVCTVATGTPVSVAVEYDESTVTFVGWAEAECRQALGNPSSTSGNFSLTRNITCTAQFEVLAPAFDAGVPLRASRALDLPLLRVPGPDAGL